MRDKNTQNKYMKNYGRHSGLTLMEFQKIEEFFGSSENQQKSITNQKVIEGWMEEIRKVEED